MLVSTGVEAQSWLWAEYDLWTWAKGEAEWRPDEATLAEARQKLESAFLGAKEAVSARWSVPSWDRYVLEYQGRVSGESRLIRIAGDCDLASRTAIRADGTKERIIVTGGGGACLFHATYDAGTKQVTSFVFNAPF